MNATLEQTKPQSLAAILDTTRDVVAKEADGRPFVVHVASEKSDFVRFNHAQVRQPMTVWQTEATLRLFDGSRHLSSTMTLSNHADTDRERVKSKAAELRGDLAALDPDPYCLFPEGTGREEDLAPDGVETDASEVTRAVCDSAAGTDFVGILANGRVERAVATSDGKERLFSRPIVHLDWSVFAGEGAPPDKAIKQALAGDRFDGAAFDAKVATAREQLPVLRRPEKHLEPGAYRAYLAPAAMEELFGLLEWGAFSRRAEQTKTSALLRLQLGEEAFDKRITVVDDAAGGTSPRFSAGGFDRPAQVSLVENGKFAGALTSPRSGSEYGIAHTGADDSESPLSLYLAPGGLASSNILEELGTGVYVGNLWYCNYSDPRACRITGMTRFGTFWVEDGVVRAPLATMRFDESLYRLLGESLIDLDDESPLSLDADTYHRRSTASRRVPGALVSGLTFTL